MYKKLLIVVTKHEMTQGNRKDEHFGFRWTSFLHLGFPVPAPETKTTGLSYSRWATKVFVFRYQVKYEQYENDVLILINDYQIGTSVKYVFFSEVLTLKSTDLASN